jgi:alkane 1-monooxygenase
MKYLKYYISTVTIISAIYSCTLGAYSPTIFFIGFSFFIIIGDMFIGEDLSEQNYSFPFLLNLPIYINFSFLILFVLITVYMLGSESSNIFSTMILDYLRIDLNTARVSINSLDSIFLVALTSLFIGVMGTVPGHELVHRKKNRFDMFMGNWLMAISWDCAFAIEHVYGHHKNIGLSTDPATAKRGENIYRFIFQAIIKEQKDAWIIESDQLKRRKESIFSFKNRMLKGYFRSFVITLSAFIIGGFSGMLIYLLCAFTAKALLETINYCEHYGLVRASGQLVFPRHSWNSNSILSSLYLYNVTRHSSHHEKANLKYWELKAYKDAPTLPQGYLTMLFLAVFTPYYFHKIMSKKVIEWDNTFATKEEKLLSQVQNEKSGIPILINQLSK